MEKPSFKSSPWIRGAPHRVFSRDIRRTRSRISLDTGGRPGFPRRDFHVQKSLNPLRCQPMTVSGLTITRAWRQPGHRQDRMTQKTLSAFRSNGRSLFRFRTATCCRRARISVWSAARSAKISMILCMPERVSGGDAKFQGFCDGWNKWEGQLPVPVVAPASLGGADIDPARCPVERAGISRGLYESLDEHGRGVVALGPPGRTGCPRACRQKPRRPSRCPRPGGRSRRCAPARRAPRESDWPRPWWRSRRGAAPGAGASARSRTCAPSGPGPAANRPRSTRCRAAPRPGRPGSGCPCPHRRLPRACASSARPDRRRASRTARFRRSPSVAGGAA